MTFFNIKNTVYDKVEQIGKENTMSESILTFETISDIVRPIAERYGIEAVYLFGSYARDEATADSDLDFLVFGGKDFKLTLIFAFAEDLRKSFKKKKKKNGCF